jgi:hypothetical protein
MKRGLRSAWCAALFVGLLCALPLSVQAQADSKSAYTQLISRALAEYEGGRWQESYALFERAHAERPSARTLRGMGLASFEMRDYVGCLRALEAALVHPERKLDAEQRTQAEDLIKQAKEFVARREITIEPEHAQVLIDGDTAELRAGTLLLNPGDHELTASAEGYTPLRMTVNARSGSSGKLALVLERAEGAVASTPEVKDAAEPTTPVEPPSRADTEGGSVLPIVVIAVGGALIVGAAITGIVSLDAASELEALCGPDKRCPPAAADIKSRGQTTQTLTWILGPAGVVALGVGVALALAQSGDEAPALALGCDPSGCSAHARVAF